METAIDTYSQIGIESPEAIAFVTRNTCDVLGSDQSDSNSITHIYSSQISVFNHLRGTNTLAQAILSLTGVSLNGFGYSYASILKILAREGHHLLSFTSGRYVDMSYPSALDLTTFYGPNEHDDYYSYKDTYALDSEVNPFFYCHLLKRMLSPEAYVENDPVISSLMQLQLAQGASENPVHPMVVYEFLCYSGSLSFLYLSSTRILFAVSKRLNQLEIFINTPCVLEVNVAGKKTPSHFNNLVALEFGVAVPYYNLQSSIEQLSEAELKQAYFIFNDNAFEAYGHPSWEEENEHVSENVKNFYRRARKFLCLVQALCTIRERREMISTNKAVSICTELYATGASWSNVQKALRKIISLPENLAGYPLNTQTVTELYSYGVTAQMLLSRGFLVAPLPVNPLPMGPPLIIPTYGFGVRRVRVGVGSEEQSLANFMSFIGQNKYGDALALLRDDFDRLSLHLGQDNDEWYTHMSRLFSPFFISCESVGPACRESESSGRADCAITMEPLQDQVVKFPCGRNPPHLFNISDPEAPEGRQKRMSGWMGQIMSGTTQASDNGRIAIWSICPLCRGQFRISDEQVAQLRQQYP